MIVFDVKCDVREAVHVTDSAGRDVTIAPGRYRMVGIDHLVREASGGASVGPMDITLVGIGDGETKYLVSAENLGHFIALDQVEVKI